MTTNTATAAPAVFKVGTTYEVRSLGDWDCIFSFTVVARTAKRMTIASDMFHCMGKGDGTKVVGVKVWDGCEVAKPLGTYSLSPTLRADRTTA